MALPEFVSNLISGFKLHVSLTSEYFTRDPDTWPSA